MNPSYQLSILVPTIDEGASLRETVETLTGDAELDSDILEIILVTCDRTSDETLKTCQELKTRYGPRVYTVTQRLGKLGGAFRSGIAEARGSHVVTMFADLESDPRLVPKMVSESKAFPDSIVSASRWKPGGGFRDYGWFKLVLNWLFQRLCGFGCKANVSDFTYGFRVYPAAVLKEIPWRETDHAFVVEAILRPHFRKVPIREVAALWSPRKEGERRPRLKQYLGYVPTVCRAWGQYHFRRSQNLAWHARKTVESSTVDPGLLISAQPGTAAESLLAGR